TLARGRSLKACVLSKKHLGAAHNQVASHDVLISTPLRLVYAIKIQAVRLDKVEHMVLDEADKLLEIGFLDQIDEIMAACPVDGLRRYLFSATMPSSVERLAKTFLVDPVRVVIGHTNAATATIRQRLAFVSDEAGKLIELRQMVRRGELRPPALVFVQSVERARELFRELVYDGLNVDVVHADRPRAQRDAAVEAFRAGKTWVLVATDLLARGVDFKGVEVVVNYDFPQSAQAYVHRIGRTGRAGRPGDAVTFFTRADAEYLRIVVNVMRESGCDVPEWMLDLHNPT
ncbi:RNA-dependent ATPase rok1, partial [Cladochytrium tenue]